MKYCLRPLSLNPVYRRLPLMKYRRKILCLLLCFFALSCVKASPGVTSRPYLSQVTNDSIVVTWRTAIPTSSVVEYGETTAYGFTVKSDMTTRFHCLCLTGLKPSMEYHYRVRSENGGKDYTFHTAVKPGEAFTFAVYGDSQPNDENHVNVLRQILKVRPLFILHTGDLVHHDEENDWHDYFRAICDETDVGETIPVYAVMGNHDGVEHGEDALFLSYLVLPLNHFLRSEGYYSFNIGDAHFIALNSYLPYEPGSPQYEWLANDLRKSSAYKWKFVFLHEPPYSTGKHGSNISERRVLCPLFEKASVDIVFAGHNHLYERTREINGVTYIVTGGGGAPLYDAEKMYWIAASESSHHFCKVHISQNLCAVEMIREDGTISDKFTMLR